LDFYGVLILKEENNNKLDSGVDNNLSAVGAYLKKNREDRGVSLEEIASATKINRSILHYLENDRFDKLPSAVFVRGFIRSYLKYLDVDPKQAILFYELITRGAEKKEGDPKDIADEGPTVSKTSLSKKIWTRISKPRFIFPVAIILSILVFFSLYYARVLFKAETKGKDSIVKIFAPQLIKPDVYPRGISLPELKPGDTVSNTVNGPAPLDDTVQNTGTKNIENVEKLEASKNTGKDTGKNINRELDTELNTEISTVKNTDASLTKTVNKEQVLTIKATRDVWIKAQIDEEPVFDFLLKENEVHGLKAKGQVKLLLGNAGSMNIIYNGKDMGSLGPDGQVKSIVFPGLGRWKDAMQ
jgi:cytoskeletal protein RodZ